MTVEFCIPVYNEEKIIEKNIMLLYDYCQSQNFQFSWKIILINNGSTDATETICKKLSNDKILIENILLAGKGRALKTYWKKSNAEILVYMDCDLAVALNNIPDLLSPLLEKDYDLVIGSRMLPDSKTKRPFLRELSSQTFNFLSRIILRHNFTDSQCGFKAFKKEVVEKVGPFILDNKWYFDQELIIFANFFKFRIKEIPVDWRENRYDERKTKVKMIRDGIIFIRKLINLKIRLSKLKK